LNGHSCHFDAALSVLSGIKHGRSAQSQAQALLDVAMRHLRSGQDGWVDSRGPLDVEQMVSALMKIREDGSNSG